MTIVNGVIANRIRSEYRVKIGFTEAIRFKFTVKGNRVKVT